MLRSAHAGEENTPAPDPILSVTDDMWCALFATIVKADQGEGQVWKLGSPLTVAYSDYPTVWGSRGPEDGPDGPIVADVIFNRGGYAQYESALNSCPGSTVLYYGAGKRWCPDDGIQYDLILVDTASQKRTVESKHPDTKVVVFHKPAADALFYPREVRKQYDLVVSAATPKAYKGLKWAAKRIPNGVSVLRIGEPDPWFKAIAADGYDITWSGRLARKDVPAWACKAKLAVVCNEHEPDSGPRTLPEFLAMDIPVLLRDTVRVDAAAYIVPKSGMMVDDNNFGNQVIIALANLSQFKPRQHYLGRFGLRVTAHNILRAIERL